MWLKINERFNAAKVQKINEICNKMCVKRCVVCIFFMHFIVNATFTLSHFHKKK